MYLRILILSKLYHIRKWLTLFHISQASEFLIEIGVGMVLVFLHSAFFWCDHCSRRVSLFL